MKAPFIRSPYNYDVTAASDEAAKWGNPPGESLTVQSMAEDVDLNVIMKRFGVTGKMPDNARPMFFGDFENIYDFKTAQNAVRAGQEAFDLLPADVRERFVNDPQRFLVFCSDPANMDELRKMGLAKEKSDAGVVPGAGAPSRAHVGSPAGGGGADQGSAGGSAPAGSGSPGSAAKP